MKTGVIAGAAQLKAEVLRKRGGIIEGQEGEAQHRVLLFMPALSAGEVLKELRGLGKERFEHGHEDALAKAARAHEEDMLLILDEGLELGRLVDKERVTLLEVAEILAAEHNVRQYGSCCGQGGRRRA